MYRSVLRSPLPYVGLILLLAAVLWGVPLAAQDGRFSQLNTTPLLTNPALTAIMNGDLRVSLNYQRLLTTLDRGEGYRNLKATVERRLPVGRSNFAGVGVVLQHDRAGIGNFIRTQGMLSGSYQQLLSAGPAGRSQYLSIGAQLGFGQRGFDFNKLWFSEQYFVDPVSRQAYIDRSLPSGEPFGGVGSRFYPDVNTGVAWLATFGRRRSAYAGLAVYHLTAPNVSPLPEFTDALDRRYVVYLGGELPLGGGPLSLLPAARLMRQGPAAIAQFGGNLRYQDRRQEAVALRTGIWLQITDGADEFAGASAMVVQFALEFEAYQLGVSYDLIVGALANATAGRGGFEISAIYTRPAAGRARVRCPKF